MSSVLWEAVTSRQFPDANILTKRIDDHRVDVFVPRDVNRQSPVLVMHDGKNVFFPEFATTQVSWGVIDAISNQGIPANKAPVVVSVWGTESDVPGARYFELAPENVLIQDEKLWGSLLTRANIPMSNLNGNQYQSLIATKVLPGVADAIGVDLNRNRTAICGSSMGGLASIYGASLYPDSYGTVLSLSTHWAFWNEGFIEALLALLPEADKPRVWIDRGDLDLDVNYIGLHERAEDILVNRGWKQGVNLNSRIFAGTGHNESAWAGRISEVINWWLEGIPD